MGGFEDWTVEDVLKHNAKINENVSKNSFNIKSDKVYISEKKNKYNAKKIEIDGVKFDSRKEADFYCELKIKLQAKQIKGFCRQAQFVLSNSINYKADFIVFNNDDTTDIIDVKGFPTDVYKIKKKLFEEKYNLKIIEV